MSVLNVAGTKRPPFTRLVGVELRKMADTRAGLWLLIAIGAITAIIITIFFFAAEDDDKIFENFIGITATPQGFLLPVLGILLVTQEWTQRTALTTFALTASRSRVIAAKVAAALVLGFAAIVIAITIASLATVIAGSENAWEGIGADDMAKYCLLQISGILQGLAFGLIFLNSAAAIVTFFVLPTAFSIIANVWSALKDIGPWIDLGTAQTPLFEATDVTGEQWAQITTASMIWIVLPFAIGLWRVLRAELK